MKFETQRGILCFDYLMLAIIGILFLISTYTNVLYRGMGDAVKMGLCFLLPVIAVYFARHTGVGRGFWGNPKVVIAVACGFNTILHLFLFVRNGIVDDRIQLVFCLAYILGMMEPNSETWTEKGIYLFLPWTILLSMSNGTKAGGILLAVGYFCLFREKKQILLTIGSVLGAGILQIAVSGNYLWQRLFADSVMGSEQAYAAGLMLPGTGRQLDILQLPDGYREYFPAFIKGNFGSIIFLAIGILQILLIFGFIRRAKRNPSMKSRFYVLVGIFGFRFAYGILMNFGLLPVTSIVLPCVLADAGYAMFDGLLLAVCLKGDGTRS